MLEVARRIGKPLANMAAEQKKSMSKPWPKGWIQLKVQQSPAKFPVWK